MTVELIALGHKLATFRASFRSTADEVLECLKDFYEKHPDIHNIVWILEVGSMDFIRYEDAEDIIEFISAHQNPTSGRTAFVVSNDLEAGMSNVFDKLAEIYGMNREVEVFETYKDAHEWAEKGVE